MNDMERAAAMLASGSYGCVLCKGEIIYTSNRQGVIPLMDYLSSGTSLTGFSAADKVVGKAAALLYVLIGIKQVYAEIMSDGAIEILRQYQIPSFCAQQVPYIKNRNGTGVCPMEQAVAETDDPEMAWNQLQRTIEQMKQPAQQQTEKLLD